MEQNPLIFKSKEKEGFLMYIYCCRNGEKTPPVYDQKD